MKSSRKSHQWRCRPQWHRLNKKFDFGLPYEFSLFELCDQMIQSLHHLRRWLGQVCKGEGNIHAVIFDLADLAEGQ